MAGSKPQRFRAEIKKHRSNPYVDVPQRVSRALASHATAGRIAVEGKLDGKPFRATLMPLAAGGHRLYVNGGMRSAAGVDVADLVQFTIWPASSDVTVADDVLQELRKSKGALAAFCELPPSHRRELLRYIDDARSASGRKTRIKKTAQHVLGKPPQKSRGPKSKPLWTCPECGRQFVNKNSFHSCHRYRLSDCFRGKPQRIKKLFDKYRQMIESCGPVKLVPYKDRVAFMVRVRFAGATPKQNWLDIGFWLTRRLKNKRFVKVETIMPNVHAHRMRITDEKQLDAQLLDWLRQSYAIGCQEHLE